LSKKRLDVMLCERGFTQSRERARRIIMAGVVFVNNNREDKPGSFFEEDVEIFIKENVNPFVSRGGLKLEKALESFCIDMSGAVALDVGASTGGFTDCMLKHGALKVYAIDVGYGQLAWELRQDERVRVMERTNIRYVKTEQLDELAGFASIDVSFISLKLVLPVVYNLLEPFGQVVCLIKPQFEAGRDKVGKKGVVKDAKTHLEVVEGIALFASGNNYVVKGLDYSPIKGPEGNIEYLMHLEKTEYLMPQEEYIKRLSNEVVAKAHNELDK